VTEIACEADIPPLDDMRPLSEWLGLLRAFAQGGSVESVSFALQMNAVRLIDAAVRDYEAGRRSVIQFHCREPSEFGLGWAIQATSYFESSAWHLYRAVQLLRKLRRRNEAEPGLRAAVPRGWDLLSDGPLQGLRNAVTHLEGETVSGAIPSGTPIALLPTPSGPTLGTEVIPWRDLERWLRDAHACAERLAHFQQPRAKAPE
jgi:hypothetical protein